MTTIACDFDSMAGDGQTHRGGVIVAEDTVKVLALSDGTLAGFCGSRSLERVVVAWWEGGCKGKCSAAKETNALFLKPDRTIWFLDDYGYVGQHSTPQAIGSGMEYALAAMAAGASPEKAVRIASRFDPTTGGKVTVLHLSGASSR